jgi:hypothetical protein
MNSTYLDQEKKIDGLWLLVREQKRNVKCGPGVPDVSFPAVGYAFGNIACQRGLNTDGLTSQ